VCGVVPYVFACGAGGHTQHALCEGARAIPPTNCTHTLHTQEPVGAWVEEVKEPLVPEMDSATYRSLTQRGRPVVVGVVDPSDKERVAGCVCLYVCAYE